MPSIYGVTQGCAWNAVDAVKLSGVSCASAGDWTVETPRDV